MVSAQRPERRSSHPAEPTVTDRTPLLSSAHFPSFPSSSSSSSSAATSAAARPTQSPAFVVPAPSSASRPRATSDSSSAIPNHSLGALRGTCVALSLGVLIFIQATNMSGMTIIQGTIAAELEAYDAAMWFTTAYLIAASSLAPLAGRLTTIFSPRALALPIALFVAAGSLVSSRARSTAAFITGRVLTGVGAAGVMTLALVLVLELTSKTSRGLFIGLVNAGFTVGVSGGAVLYGAALPLIGWRPLFWIQIPFSILAGAGVYFSIPQSMSPAKPGSVVHKVLRIDYVGAILLVSTIVFLLYGLAGDIQLWPLLASLGSLVLFVAFEYLIALDPIIPLTVLSSRGVLLSCLAQLGLMSARWTVLFYSPIFMLAVRGAPPAAAGSVLIPTNLGFGLGGLLVGWLHIKRSGSFWMPTVASVALFALSLYALSRLGTPESPLAAYVTVLFANGAVTGAALNYTLAHMLHQSHRDTQYISTSLLGTFRGFGGSIGTSIGGGIFYRLLRAKLTDGFLELDGGHELSLVRQRLVFRLLGTPELVFRGGLGPDAQHVAIRGYAAAASGVWQAAAILGLLVIAVQAATGWSAAGVKDGDPELRAEVITEEEEEEEEEEARARVTESEGVGEA